MSIMMTERFRKEFKSLAMISIGTILFAIGMNCANITTDRSIDINLFIYLLHSAVWSGTNSLIKPMMHINYSN